MDSTHDLELGLELSLTELSPSVSDIHSATSWSGSGRVPPGLSFVERAEHLVLVSPPGAAKIQAGRSAHFV